MSRQGYKTLERINSVIAVWSFCKTSEFVLSGATREWRQNTQMHKQKSLDRMDCFWSDGGHQLHQGTSAFTLAFELRRWVCDRQLDKLTDLANLGKRALCMEKISTKSSASRKLWLIVSIYPVSIGTKTRWWLCHSSDPHPGKGLALSWVWNIGVLDIAMFMSTTTQL